MRFFYGNRLTNAHNEWLTILVDIGVLGLVSYAGMMISVIRNFLHAGKKSMLVGACGICVLAYTVNNMFSFQQVMNISTVFVIMGIGGICGVQPVIEPAKVEFMVSASVGPGRGPPDLVGSPLRFGRSRPRSPDLVGSPLRFGRSRPRSPGPRGPSAPERCVRNQLEVVSLNSCKNKNNPHTCVREYF